MMISRHNCMRGLTGILHSLRTGATGAQMPRACALITAHGRTLHHNEGASLGARKPGRWGVGYALICECLRMCHRYKKAFQKPGAPTAAINYYRALIDCSTWCAILPFSSGHVIQSMRCPPAIDLQDCLLHSHPSPGDAPQTLLWKILRIVRRISHVFDRQGRCNLQCAGTIVRRLERLPRHWQRASYPCLCSCSMLTVTQLLALS